MEPTIDLAPGAEDNPIAVYFADSIRASLATSERKRSDFRAMRACVHLVAQDIGDAVTLRFDHGRLTIHDGSIGIPSVTFCADGDVLRRLGELPATRWLRVPVVLGRDASTRRALRDVAERFLHGNLKIYGLVAHPRLVLRFLRMVSPRE